ncbi:hypothetical protein HPP92_007948 [Vanilla planifolia]|uniref:Uncharacterized protein n=1 Tax=Vanilla planifolia TaxID=51239 RepID=A0A835RMR9_VANPL|nr:hypothetical protein HPP92_007948 [Vanilla planifolia]
MPPKKKPPVNLAQPSAVWSLSASFFRPVSVSDGAAGGSPSLNEAMPYMVRQMEESMGETHLDPPQQRAHGGAVGWKVGEIPRNQRARSNRGLQAADERIAVDRLNDLERRLQQHNTEAL